MNKKSILLSTFVVTLALFATLDLRAQVIDSSSLTSVLIPGNDAKY